MASSGGQPAGVEDVEDRGLAALLEPLLEPLRSAPLEAGHVQIAVQLDLVGDVVVPRVEARGSLRPMLLECLHDLLLTDCAQQRLVV
ncbi:MAG: hypothetical protein HC927_09955 [Deltaproteobacteria bacterium]|nr:hypothetical protein [Deltaproteobacteria bacterium]